MTNSPAPPRRKRFQFSLRTLVICVLTYGFLWVLTIKWGGYQLAQFQADVAQNDFGYVWQFGESDGTLIVKDKKLDWRNCHGKTTSPAPFVLIWEWQKDKRPNEFERETWLWLFGIKYRLSYTGWQQRDIEIPDQNFRKALFE